MNSIMELLKEAAEFGTKNLDRALDRRQFYIGAIGIRDDGAKVKARNSASDMISPHLHAEARLSRKLDVGAEVYVARVKKDGSWGSARPCRNCRAIMRARGVKRVYYTIADNEYGVIDLESFKEESKPTGIRLSKFDSQRWRRGES